MMISVLFGGAIATTPSIVQELPESQQRPLRDSGGLSVTSVVSNLEFGPGVLAGLWKLTLRERYAWLEPNEFDFTIAEGDRMPAGYFAQARRWFGGLRSVPDDDDDDTEPFF